MNRRRFALATAVACVLVAFPTLVALPLVLEMPTGKMPPFPLSTIGGALLFVLAPGYIAYSISAELLIRLVHADSAVMSPALITIGILISVLFWTAIFHLLLSAYAHLRSRRHSPKG